MKVSIKKAFLTTFFSSLVFSAPSSYAETPSTEEMWKIIQEQQKIIEQLQQKLDQNEQNIQVNTQKVEETVQKVEVTEQKVEETAQEVEAAAEAIETASSSTTGSGWWEKTSLGGYGELHFNSRDGDDQVDFHRYVLYVGHEFTDNVRFFSEFELEHSLVGEGKEGELELEQAWIEIDISDNHRFRAGLDILPLGIINVTHEPDTFYGVERNRVESEVIPSTWWEAGAGFNGEIAPGWNYHVVIHSGLSVPTTGSNAGRIRSGRNKVAEAEADNGAGTVNLRYTGMPGLELGTSFQYQSDITEGGNAPTNEATLFTFHGDYKHSSGFGLRALYARWDIDNVIEAGREDDEQDGFYIEPSYRFSGLTAMGDIGIFGRWQQLDLANDREEESLVAGIQWWPVDRVVFKFDYEDRQDEDANTSQDIYSLGLGFSF